MSYQRATGPLCPGGHPGSYNGQDAYNDMLVVDNGNCDGIGTGKCRHREGGGPTLNASHEQPILMSDRKGHNGVSTDGTSTTLNAQEKERPIVGTSIVRRLTPRECERLQGFPDDWTLIGEPEEVEVKDYAEVVHSRIVTKHDDDGNEYEAIEITSIENVDTGTTHKEVEYYYIDRDGKRKRCADSARYRALGNSIAVGYSCRPTGFWMWLMGNISAQYDRPATLGSLFDGIGGFPLAWEHYNGKGSAVWASEIEPFCIEVTRRRFPEGDEINTDELVD